MLLFVFGFESVAISIGAKSHGHQNWTFQNETAVVAYADDVIFVTAPEGLQLIRDLLRTYGRATGACLNIRKSKAMVAVSWDTSVNILDIPYGPEITIMGFRFISTVARFGNVS
jgi:hypothetical protein